MKTPIDIHSHYSESKTDNKAIVSLSVATETTIFKQLELNTAIPLSIGLHPWHVTPDWKELYLNSLYHAAFKNRVVGIGEAGLDRLHGGEWKYQLEAFRAQADLAEEADKPLIIHCLKAFDELLLIHKEMKPKQNWIIHGFRGKEIQAQQILQHGFMLSFGEYYHEQALQICPLESLFIETDESSIDIETLYIRAAKVKSISLETLQQQIKTNITNIFNMKP